MKTIIGFLLMLTLVASAQTNTNKFKPYVPRAVVTTQGEATDITVVSVDGVLSTYYKCTISGAPVGQVFLAGLPANVKAEHDLVRRLEAFVVRESEDLKAAEKKLRADIAAGPSSASSGTAAGNYIRANNIRDNQITDRTNALDEQVEKLKDARARFAKISQISAMSTGRTYAGLPIWQVVPKVEKK